MLDLVVSIFPKESFGFELKNSSETEFISDKFKSTNGRDLAEIQQNFTRLSMMPSVETQADNKKNSPTGKNAA